MERLKNRTVLIADDAPLNRLALGAYLENANLTVEMAENGMEVLEKLRAGLTPDVILLDMTMPVMDGYETLRELRKDETLSKIPVIAATAHAMKGDREKCMDAGAWDYITKPIDVKALIFKLIQLFDNEP